MMSSIHPKKIHTKTPNYEVNRVCPSSQKAQSGLFGPLGINQNGVIPIFPRVYKSRILISNFYFLEERLLNNFYELPKLLI